MKLKDFCFFSAAAILAIVLVAITFTSYTAFSGFAAGIAKATIGIILFYAFDNIVLNEVDTIHELKKGNTAYAIFLFAFAVILSATIATA